MDSSASSRWSTLPRDILEGVTKRLDCTRIQILKLRAVCSAWRSIVSIPANTFGPNGSTLKLPYPDNILEKRPLHVFTHPDYVCCLLKESTIYCVEPLTEVLGDPKSSVGYWFAKIEETESGKVRLMDPFSGLTKENFRDNVILPQQRPDERCNFGSFTLAINLLDYRVTEVVKTYDLVGVSFDESGELQVNSSRIKKVVVGYDNNSKFSVMALGNRGDFGVWKMADNQWVKVNCGRKGKFLHDISYHNGRFYGVDASKTIIAVDLSSLEVTLVVPPMVCNTTIAYLHKYLVNSLGDLYLIHRRPRHQDLADANGNGPTIDAEVYKLNEEQGKWISVKSLGNQVMFVGDRCCLSVSATEFVGLKGNCVFEVEEYRSGHYVGDFQIWNASLSDLEDQTAALSLRFGKGCFRSFWPPPTWLEYNYEVRKE
ncbi:hypothetical protein FNV43_RR06481 [Rhamnella rubrinervis]|uniref:KIB1-4 beta-propeller domain-containing protein n=1 Tax=Rhamnella rubrinervis TaxID=2594499 RepID=A0A8K0HDM3_9ROSA|nr:hypothetical protein FNV43_RR06481 [Rhamnella rubrinervis]